LAGNTEVIPFGYADDVALWYEVDFDHCITTAVINQDLQSLHEWGLDNKTTFEPEKMEVIVISQSECLSMRQASCSMVKS
jgi:hypothetical protein